MKLGMVGLGRMGANMVERLRRHGHEVETYARTSPERTAGSLVELASRLDQPRVVWLMIPAGTPTQMAFETMLPLLEDGDVIVDGGNSKYTDDQVHDVHRTGTEPHHASRPTEVSIPALGTVTTVVTFPAAGSLLYVCHLPGHEAYGMVGTLTIS